MARCILFIDSVCFDLAVESAFADAKLLGCELTLVVVALEGKQDVAFLHVADAGSPMIIS